MTSNGTSSDCENFTTNVIDFKVDKYIEVNCSVTSKPKSTFTWTTFPVEDPGKAVRELNEVKQMRIYRSIYRVYYYD